MFNFMNSDCIIFCPFVQSAWPILIVSAGQFGHSVQQYRDQPHFPVLFKGMKSKKHKKYMPFILANIHMKQLHSNYMP